MHWKQAVIQNLNKPPDATKAEQEDKVKWFQCQEKIKDT